MLLSTCCIPDNVQNCWFSEVPYQHAILDHARLCWRFLEAGTDGNGILSSMNVTTLTCQVKGRTCEALFKVACYQEESEVAGLTSDKEGANLIT